ncbi:MAG: arylsulfatase A-like enzyme, partial [Verrucomicrobiales bacterium]
FMGSDFYETPHLDKLAASGMIFTDAYAGAANCAPSRACLLSGQYSPRHEIYNVGTGARGKSQHRRLKHISGTDTLRKEIKTWAQCAQEAGYVTATMGKWHLSDDPLPYGFDVNIGGTHSGGPPRGYFPPHGKVPGLGETPAGEYVTDRLSAEAAEFITVNKAKPWLLYLTHFAVHTPLQAKQEDVKRYEAKAPGKIHNHTVMAGMIKSVDDGIGKLVATLDSLGLKDNTAIIFYSDNGGYGPATSMAPLKGYKGTYYEGGIRVPFCVNWPAVVKAGTRCAVPIAAVDILPSFCEMTGAQLPKDQPVDGMSILPLLKGGTLAERSIFWHFPAYLQSYQRADEQRDPLFRSRPCSIIRDGDWKLHEYFEDGALELYNLKSDLSEKTNLADANPEKRNELHDKLKSWRKATRAPVPSEKNPDFDAAVEREAIEAAGSKKKKKRKRAA